MPSKVNSYLRCKYFMYFFFMKKHQPNNTITIQQYWKGTYWNSLKSLKKKKLNKFIISKQKRQKKNYISTRKTILHRKSTISKEINMKWPLFNCYDKFWFWKWFLVQLTICVPFVIAVVCMKFYTEFTFEYEYIKGSQGMFELKQNYYVQQ